MTSLNLNSLDLIKVSPNGGTKTHYCTLVYDMQLNQGIVQLNNRIFYDPACAYLRKVGSRYGYNAKPDKFLKQLGATSLDFENICNVMRKEGITELNAATSIDELKSKLVAAGWSPIPTHEEV